MQAQPASGLNAHGAVGGVDSAFRGVFEDNIEELVKNINVFDQNGSLINGLLANETQAEQL